MEVCLGYKNSFANPKELLATLQSLKADVDLKRNEGGENEDFAFDDVTNLLVCRRVYIDL